MENATYSVPRTSINPRTHSQLRRPLHFRKRKWVKELAWVGADVAFAGESLTESVRIL